MRDISEIPGGPEQAKPASAKPRVARPRTENQTPGSQEQETKNAPRRRTTPVTNSSSPAVQGQSGNEQAVRPAPTTATAAPTTPVAPATPAPQNNPAPATTRPSGPPPGVQGNNAPRTGSAPMQQGSNAPRNGPPFTQQGSGAPRTGSAPMQQGSNAPRNGPPFTQQGSGAPRTGPNQGYRNTGSAPGQRPYNNNGRPNGPGVNAPNNGSGPRPSTPYRGSAPNTQQRQGNGPAPQRTFSTPDRTPGQGQGTHNQSQRPGGGGQRSGGQNNQGGNRPGARPNNNGNTPNNGPRTQERRTPVVKEKPTGPISLPPQIIVKDLADMLSVTPIEVIRDLINKHSIFASINEVVDYEKAALAAKDLGFEPSPAATTETRVAHQLSANEVMMATRNDENMVIIPPVVTIMGHVDHGKTSLLDMIRKTKVAAGEAGGITQHIGAYQVEVNGKKITFLDTPGHEAFTAMRARGAQVTHIAIIVVAADDGVMPQTKEAIDHAKAAKVPIIIALNKIDKANANPDRVKQQLAEIGIVIEEYGGDTVCVPVSARRGEGIDELLDYILLVAEVQDIKANPNRLATGVIIEARLEKNSGATATVLVQQGTLKMGDNIVVGSMAGKVRAMFNDRGKRIQKAPPSMPVSVLGLSEVPQAGDHLEATEDERTAKLLAQRELEKRREETAPFVSLDTLYMQMQEGTVKELDVVLKSDVQGSAEAIKGALSKLGEENMKVRLIHEGIGNVSETDVHLAGASGAIIVAFNVKADGAAQREAQREHVDIRYYEIIYKLIEDIQAALVGMLEPTYREVIDGHAEVIQIFKAGKTTVIAGSRITDGKLTRSSQARLLRKSEKIYDGKVASLRRGKDDVREVLTGYECGIVLEDFSDYEIGDIIEVYSQERVAPGASA